MMNKQDYLRKKGILPKQDFGKIYIVVSTREEATLKECDVYDISQLQKMYYSDSTRLFNNYQYMDDYLKDITILQDTKSGESHGYGTGFGDLWGWSVFGFLDRENAEIRLEMEKSKIKKYKSEIHE
jgi:hypothetical protein